MIKVENLSFLDSIFESELNIRSNDGTSIIELSEGNNLGDNDGFLMILVGSITSPKVIILPIVEKSIVFKMLKS